MMEFILWNIEGCRKQKVSILFCYHYSNKKMTVTMHENTKST